MEALFATSNQHKLAEASAILGKCGVVVRQFPFDHREIRSDRLEDVAREAAEAAHEACGRPVFVEDSGLFIHSLHGFPGTYSAWVQRKVGNGGILRLMKGVEDRTACYQACIGYHDGNLVSVYHGVCHGSIARRARGAGGFGYDPIFVPEGQKQTFGERIELKNNLSHRYKALLEFSTALASMR